ncbi:hypothetical protein [Endozoicomonas lisbonensis]|uniref:Uncharacterized protein n=1 Tax=Endozoicomonas lisbonensis TaxID=3120522 RepID=A0ABV2SDG8_9GAMM
MQFTRTLSASSLMMGAALFISPMVSADTADEELQDMSDPLAVYTQVGAGYTDKGLNIKIGRTYDTGNPATMGMNVIELKGVAGDALGWNGGSDQRKAYNRNNSADSFRFRNTTADFSRGEGKGRGNQLDLNYDFRSESGTLSYSFLQEIPKNLGRINIYPLAGAGVAFGNNIGDDNRGYSVPGSFAIVGMYGKLEVTDKIWLNYNPMYSRPLSGADAFMNAGSNTMHEFATSYQINPRTNIRYFANWSNSISYRDGDHRIEINYQI